MTPNDVFEAAILEYGVVAACEWFGHAADSEFTRETVEHFRWKANEPQNAVQAAFGGLVQTPQG